jgi:hypothetical protein
MSIWLRSACLSGLVIVSGLLVFFSSSTTKGQGQGQNGRDPVLQTAERLVTEGRDTFRFDTFGDEDFWGGTLQLHRAIEGGALGVGSGLTPRAALQLGLKVDVDALPSNIVQAFRRGAVDLDSPATTLALLKSKA